MIFLMKYTSSAINLSFDNSFKYNDFANILSFDYILSFSNNLFGLINYQVFVLKIVNIIFN